MERHRIAVFIDSLQFGGAEWVAINLAHGFFEAGHTVDLVVTRKSGDLVGEVAKGIRVIDFAKGRSAACLLPLAKYLRLNQPDFLLSAMTHNNVIAILARTLARARTLVVVREVAHMSSMSRDGSSVRARYLPIVARLALPLADKVVANSSQVASDLIAVLNLSAGLITVIPNPAVRPSLADMSRQPISDVWFQPGSPPVVLGVGRLSKEKDFPTLLRAFKEVRRRRESRLVILGEGPERRSLEILAQQLGIDDDVAMPGFEMNPYRYMARCAVFVLPSAHEGFGNVLPEALACGAPVVATDCPGGPREILEDGLYGALVPVGNWGAMAEAIDAALDDPPPSDFLKNKAEQFTVRTIARRYLDVFNQVCRSGLRVRK